MNDTRFPIKLRDAQADLLRRMPCRETPWAEWVDFHRYNARMFAAIAETDPAHKWEALACHGIQLRCVERLTKRPEWKEDYQVTPNDGESSHGEVL
ncbi:AMED_5909 family protein [Amycolatopsis sp. WQ 127309]|uniref:AMED_5909 family protein n=1 Tax=Amycolatopsis sp. WQ 127309 TaxID=2932773 RepID=UPI001FF532AA|nr:AMED_5909 family protein [Amycolatopsis sp. WQ 127309]UOZ07501.1 hypothetical protein MUY22_04180 [Amycolatopsis sp. WQ 127309]